MSLWNDNSRMILIDQIQQREFIWDPGHPDYHSKCRKAVAIGEITDVLNQTFFPNEPQPKYTPDEVRNQWKNLKDTFKRKQRWITEGRYARDPQEEPTWKFFRSLKFLEKTAGSSSMVENEEDSCPFPTGGGSSQNSGASEDVALSLFPTCFRSLKRSPSNSPPPTPSNAGVTTKHIPVSATQATETIHVHTKPTPTSSHNDHHYAPADTVPSYSRAPLQRPSTDEGPVTKKRWCPSAQPHNHPSSTSSSSATVEDEFSWFGVGVANALRRIAVDSRVAALRLQKSINDLIFEAELARLE